MKRTIGYFVRYSVDGEWYLNRFSTKEDRDSWVTKFLLDQQVNSDAWIELVFNGAVDYTDTGVVSA